MAKNTAKAGVKTPKTTVAVEISRNVYRPNNSKLTGNQQAQLARMQQRTARKMANKGAEYIRAGGEAISSVTSPFAAALINKHANEQATARKRDELELAKWNSLNGGNPDKETGSDPNQSGNGLSTTDKSGSSGSYLGG